MDDNLKESIITAIEDHYVPRDDKDKNLMNKQAEIILKFLEKQKNLYEQLEKINILPRELKTNENGEIIFDEGTLIHCAGKCSYDKLLGIRDKGIMAGDFIGIPESNNSETYFCADFYRTDSQMQFGDFIERIKESDAVPKRGPFGRTIGNSTKIAFILDFNPDMKKLTDTDMYRTQNSNHPMQFVLNLLESYKGEKNGRVSAIPYGVPSSFISGIIAR